MNDYMNPPTITETCYILAYDDHADGECYLAETHEVALVDAFTACLHVLAKHDNACIITKEDYNALQHDFYTIAPYAINISCGIYANPTGEYKNL